MKSTEITAKDIASKAAVEALYIRIDSAAPAERNDIHNQLTSLSVRPGIKSGQAGRIRALTNYLKEH